MRIKSVWHFLYHDRPMCKIIIIIIIIIILLKQDYKVQLANNKIQMDWLESTISRI